MDGNTNWETLLIERWEAHRREHEMLARLVDKTESQMEKRLEGMNDFRSELTRNSAQFARSEQVAEQFAAVAERTEKVEAGLRERTQKSEEEMNRRVSLLERYAANLEGRMWAIGVGIGLVSVMANVALHFVGR